MGVLVRFIAAAFLSANLSACASVGEDSTASLPGMEYSQAAPPLRGPGSPEKPPSGFVAFCARNIADCRAPSDAPETVTLTEDTWAKLEEVNLTVNQAIQPLDDSVHYGTVEYWTVPSDGYGDCDDYVLAKRKMLMLLGIPEPALRIAVVLTRSRVRHAVLTVVTDRGDYVLDNRRSEILPRSKTDYTWVERQDPASSTGWISLRLAVN